MFVVVERQSSSTSTDSGLHLQEKIKGEAWPLKSFSMFTSVFLVLYLIDYDINKKMYYL